MHGAFARSAACMHAAHNPPLSTQYPLKVHGNVSPSFGSDAFQTSWVGPHVAACLQERVFGQRSRHSYSCHVCHFTEEYKLQWAVAIMISKHASHAFFTGHSLLQTNDECSEINSDQACAQIWFCTISLSFVQCICVDCLTCMLVNPHY